MSNRVDEIEGLYKPVELFDRIASILFYMSAFLSVALPMIGDDAPKNIFLKYAPIAFIIFVIMHSFAQHINAFYYLPRAERERRKQLLSNALDVPLTHAQTQEYYNNEREPALERLSVNLMENSFFGKNICSAMLKKERIKLGFYTVLLLVALLNRATDLGVLITLTQTFFAGGVLFSWVKLEILRVKNEQIYDSLYSIHLNQNGSFSSREKAALLDIFAEYEAAKSAASIKLSSKIFYKLNPRLSAEWDRIKSTVV